MVYVVGDEYVRFDAELIKRKTKAMKKLEEEFKESQLSFNIKTTYLSRSYSDMDVWDWHKVYYEVSYLDNENEKHVLKFYMRKRNANLKTVFLTALHKGGDEKECPSI